MATQVIEVGRRSRVYTALIALAITLAVVVVVAQARSIWSGRTVSQVRPATSPYSLTTSELHSLSKGVVPLPDGCRIKYGCRGGTTSQQP